MTWPIGVTLGRAFVLAGTCAALTLLVLAADTIPRSAADTRGLRVPLPTGACTDADADGFCEDVDCGDTLPTCATDCTDADADGICRPADCDDGASGCAADCTDGDGDGVCDDRDNCPAVPNPNQAFADKLNGPLQITGDVTAQAFSPDGTHVVYLADQELEGVFELFVSHASGNGVPKKLNPSFPPGRTVSAFAVSDDAVVYLADQTTNDQFELYSVPLDGGRSVKLNPALLSVGDVEPDFRISPDGSTVVYRADQNVLDVFQLFSVPIGGGVAVKLNGTLVPGGDVVSFLASPDSTTVVFLADQELNETFELYSVPLGGGTPVKLHPPLGSAFDVQPDYGATSDGSKILYRANLDNFAEVELYAVPTSGGTPVRLSGPLTVGGNVEGFAVGPADTTVVYRADQDVDGQSDLYAVPIGGGVPVKLNGPVVSSGDVQDYRISPDGTTVVYRADQEVNERFELYSVPIGGGIPVELNGPLVAGADVGPVDGRFLVSPDNTRVVYRADQELDETFELYSVPIGGGVPVKLNGPLAAGGDVGVGNLAGEFLMTADSARVLYRANQELFERFELYSVPLDGGVPLKLNGPLIFEGDVEPGFAIGPDGGTLAYRAQEEMEDGRQLFRLSPAVDDDGFDGDRDGFGDACDCADANAGCTSDCTDADGDGFCPPHDCDEAKPGCNVDCTDGDGDGLCQPYDCDDALPECTFLCTDGDGDGWCPPVDCDDTLPACTTDCTDVDGDGICRAADCDDLAFGCDADCDDADGDGVCDDLDNCPTTANPHQGFAGKLSGVLQPAGDVTDFAFTPDGERLIYLADRQLDGVLELFAAHASGSGMPLALNPALPVGRTVQGFVTSPDGVRVLYVADQEINDKFELYSVPIAGGVAVKLNGTLVATGDVRSDFAVSPDGTRAVYRADQALANNIELYSVPIAGGVAVKLNPSLDASGDVDEFVVSPDSANVVFRGVESFSGTGALALYSTPIGGGTPIRLDDPLEGGTFPGIAVSGDGSTVLYLGTEIDDRTDLFAVPIGGGTPIKLNGPVTAGGNVTAFVGNPANATVVYRADQIEDQRFDLFVVPIGGGPQGLLNAPLVAGGDVQEFLLSPDGARVVYRADQELDQRVELFSVPAGGGIPVKLNGPLVAGGDVGPLAGAFLVTPDGATVLYRADQAVDERFELHAVPIVGGLTTTLNSPLAPGGNVADFAVTSDGALAIYQADLEVDERFELYAVPTTGGSSVKLSGQLTPGGDVVTGFAISADGATIVYGADQEVDDRVELYRVSSTVDPEGVDADGDGHGAACDCDDTTAACTVDCIDVDADGFCHATDCDDANPVCNTDCADRDGDGFCVTTDCDDANPACATDCADADRDGFCVTADCDEANASCTTDCTDVDSDGFCITADCDDLHPACTVDCTDADGDGLAACQDDCDDANPACTLDCTDADGDGFCVTTDCDDTNPTCTTDCTDGDGDGSCATSDCDDTNPSCTTDCSDADADGFCVTTDCDDTNATCTTDCTDADGDDFCATSDCDDSKPSCTTDCTDVDGDGFCLPVDCDDARPTCNVDCSDADGDGLASCEGDCDDGNPTCTTNCTDADADGFCLTTDCDDGNPACATDCTDADADGFCLTTDCDDGNAACNTNCADADGDGLRACEGDCDDANPDALPGLTEICTDGADNDCNGDVDVDDAACVGLVASNLRFTSPAALIWDPAPGADAHALYRGTIPATGFAGYDHVCEGTQLSGSTAEDPDLPPRHEGYYYLVTGQDAGGGLSIGPLGSSAAGVSRPDSEAVTCGPRVYVDPDNLVGPHDGLSWATAYTGVGSALEHAAHAGRGLEVWLRDATSPSSQPGSLSAALRPGARLLGGFAGTESASWERPAGTSSVLLGANSGYVLRSQGASLGLERVTLRQASAGVLGQPAGVWLEVVEVETEQLAGYAVDVTGAPRRLHVEGNTLDATAGQGGLRVVLGSGTLRGRVARNTVLAGSQSGMRLEARPSLAAAEMSLDVIANTVVGGATGIVLRADSTSVAHAATQSSFLGSNLIHGSSGSAVRVEAHGSFVTAGVGTVASRPLIVGNTLSDGGAAGLVCTATRTGPTSGNAVRSEPELWDNLITFHAGPGISETADNPAAGLVADPLVVGNDLHGNAALYRDEGVTDLSMAAQVNALPGAYDNYDADPGYVDRPSGDYHLLTGTALGPGSAMRYLANAADPGIGMSWVGSFDDGSWSDGVYGVGYDTAPAPNAENLLNTSVPAGATSIFTRVAFTVFDASAVATLTLGLDFDDGVAAWINGVEVFRSVSMPAGALAWDSAPAEHESSNGFDPVYETYDISAAGLPALVNGENLLAIGVWNTSAASSDLVLVPRLVINDELPAIDAGHLEAPRIAAEDLDGDLRVLDGDKLGPALPDTGADER